MLKAYYNKDVQEAGLDEAGRGCLAGPVVAAAVILPKDFKNELLNDSKQLTEAQRLELEVIIKKEAIAYSISEVSHKKIDEINILQASILAMHKAVDTLKVKPEHLLVDGNRFNPYPYIPNTCIVKGDSKFLSIAAASVLAKTYRDKLMKEKAIDYPGYFWETNYGYPTKQHRNSLKKLGITPIHRKTFKFDYKTMRIGQE